VAPFVILGGEKSDFPRYTCKLNSILNTPRPLRACLLRAFLKRFSLSLSLSLSLSIHPSISPSPLLDVNERDGRLVYSLVYSLAKMFTDYGLTKIARGSAFIYAPRSRWRIIGDKEELSAASRAHLKV